MEARALTIQMGVIHDAGATFLFEPIDSVAVYVMLHAFVTPSGLRYARGQEVGPWGNTALIARGEEEINATYEGKMREAIDFAYALIRKLDGSAHVPVACEVVDQRTI